MKYLQFTVLHPSCVLVMQYIQRCGGSGLVHEIMMSQPSTSSWISS